MIKLILKGMVMGVANIIPGVSGGTMAVSMGIYARILFALNLEKDITLIAADDALGRQLQDAELLRR